jgi:TetR/AcrR family transcriptional repressor of lmrAB and yxaGH operons
MISGKKSYHEGLRMTATRDQIIQTTCTLMELQGYHATGLNQIIKESGTPKGSLYYYFPGGKEELVVAAINEVGSVVLQRIQENLALIDNPADAIRSFMTSIAHNVEKTEYKTGGPITTVAMEAAATSERLREACQQIYADWQRAFADKLSSGGLPESRASRIAALVIAAIEGSVLLCRTQRSPQPMIEVAAEIATLVAAALASIDQSI